MSRIASVRTLLPGPADYRLTRRTWRGDLLAGLTVGIVALPLALAFGVSSGAGAASGLITAIVAGLVAAVFGGSNVQVSGPTGAMVVVLGPVLSTHGVAALPLLTVLAGLLVLVAGAARLGRVVMLLPWPVIEGFTLGIAVIIFLQQVPAAVGVAAGASANAAVAAAQAVAAVEDWSALAPLALAGVVALVMLGSARLHPRLPGSLIAIVVATLLAEALHLPVARIGALPDALPAPVAPALDLGTVLALLGPAAAVAALAAVESLLSARVAAGMADTGPWDPDRELVGQGLSSVAAAFFGGMPATGAIARTAVNVRAGGRTRLAAITHALVLLGVMTAAGTLVGVIPLAALAGVLLVTATRMVTPTVLRQVIGSTRSDTLVFVATALVTVAFDLIGAVAIGVVLAVLAALRNLTRSSGVHREALPGAPRDGDERIALFRLDGALFFGSAESVLARVSAIGDVRVVILRLSQLQMLDATGARVLADIVETLERRGVAVLFKGVQDRHLGLVRHVGALAALRSGLFTDLDEAVEQARLLAAREPTPA